MGAIKNVIVVSDLHCGCRVGLCPPEFKVGPGLKVQHGTTQRASWAWWLEFWNEWVPRVTRNEPYAVVCNGDVIDGRHHNNTAYITSNIAEQIKIAKACLDPVFSAPMCRAQYFIRGTAVHVGEDGENEETMAEHFGAAKDEDGQFSRHAMWMRIGRYLWHFAHHIGTTGRAAYETSAPMAELAEMYVEASKMRMEPPDGATRSHRHRHIEVKIPTENTYGIVFTTAGWQGRTPFVAKIPGGRVTLPQFGGSLIRAGDEEIYTRHFTRFIKRSPTVVVEIGDGDDGTE